MQQTILAISGKPGLYKLVSRGKNNLIVEALDAGVHDVRIMNGTFPHALLLESFTDAGIGTIFYRD